MAEKNKTDCLKDVQDKYAKLTSALIEKGLTISTMESCTSGLIASLITDIDGSSKATKGSFVTYSNDAKKACGVPEKIMEKYGVYSKETAEAMANACRTHYNTKIGIGVTGSLGRKDPANADSRIGEVFYSISIDGNCSTFFIRVPDSTEERADMKVYIVADILRNLDILLDEEQVKQ